METTKRNEISIGGGGDRERAWRVRVRETENIVNLIEGRKEGKNKKKNLPK